MKLSRIILLFGLLLFVGNAAFAQYDDDDGGSGRKASSKKEKVKAPKAQKSGAKQSKTREDLFRSSVNKTTYLSKKEQQKLIAKKERKKEKHYKKTRGEVNNKSTVKRMKKSERHSYKVNHNIQGSFLKRVSYSINPETAKARRKSSSQNRRLQKNQEKARDKYENTEYGKNTKKKKKNKKLRSFYNPLSN
ncbi:MAG TPA: hypothetical protein P5243_09805 [Bacteroidales bacterium]|jgi:hypothetical protein|nr:hypothetical protein [Bacteroidales bacterium]